MSNRRKLLVVLGASAFAARLDCFAQQQSAQIPRIGFLGVSSKEFYTGVLKDFRAALREFGYVEGKTIAFERKWLARHF